MYTIEIATSDFLTTQAAVAGGADRIELCSNLAEGGTTPSYGHIRKCREQFSVPICPIIRPRGGDFLYSDEEVSIMMHDVKICRDLACDAVVIGLLNSDGSIDRDRLARFVDLAYPLPVVFHRAFDRCRDPFEALETLVELGVERVLTSGQQPVAMQGAGLIASLQEKAAGRITILVGSGVRPDNISELAALTGCTEFHASLRGRVASPMDFRRAAFANDPDSYENNAVDPVNVQKLVAALKT
ncbi:MAG: copper homeostasis protein CutC [Chitinophagaceae bacterium]